MTINYDTRIGGTGVICDLCDVHLGPFHSNGQARRALRTHLLGDCPEMKQAAQ